MCWHGHINESDHRIIWFDAANMPLIRAVDAHFFEPGDPRNNEFWQVDAGDEQLWDRGRPARRGRDARAAVNSPKYRYPGEATRRLLAAAPAGADGMRTFRYVNPTTGGAVMPTLDCYAARLSKGAPRALSARPAMSSAWWSPATAARPSASRRFEWSQHDVFTIPHWTWASHEGARRRRRSVHRDRQVGVRARSTCCARSCSRAHDAKSDISPQGIGAPVRRVEDRRFLLGRGRFVADIDAARRAALRARALAARARPHPQDRHARRRPRRPASSPCSPAPTWRPTASCRCGRSGSIRSRDGTPMAEPPRYALARGTVRHVGEPVAAVIAETLRAGGRRRRAGRGRLRAAAAVIDARAAQAPARRNCTRPRPATSASAGRAATRRRCAPRSRRRRTRSRSISSTTA